MDTTVTLFEIQHTMFSDNLLDKQLPEINTRVVSTENVMYAKVVVFFMGRFISWTLFVIDDPLPQFEINRFYPISHDFIFSPSSA